MTIPVPNQGQDPWYDDLVASFAYIDGHFSTLGHTHTQSESHNAADTDVSAAAIHHTLGTSSTQAAAGDHQHTQATSHNSADTDVATTSLHHTLGTGAHQAAAGNHGHTDPPQAHASTHLGSGSDPIAAFTSSTSGLAPASGGGTSNFLRADGTWAAPPSGSGGGVNDRVATAIVYGSTVPSAIKPSATDTSKYLWVCDGTADESEINAAITAVNALGGGMVQLVGESFSLSSSILMRTGVYLRGESIGCEVKAATTMTAMIQLYDDGTHTTHATEVSHMFLNGNSQNTHGIYYNNYGAAQAFNSQPNTNPDSVHRIHNLFIRYMGNGTFAGHGIILWDYSIRASIIRDIRIQTCTGCGIIDGAADSHFENVEVGSSGSGGPTWSEGTTPSGATPTFDAVGMGFAVYSGNSMFANCKAWYSRGHGFYTKTQSIQFTNCQAQDCYRDGFKDTGGRNTYSNCEADSNNQANGAGNVNGTTYAGFRFSGSSVQAVGCLSFDRGQGWTQAYGIVVSSGATYSYIQGVTKANLTAGLSNAAPTGSTVTVVSDSGGK